MTPMELANKLSFKVINQGDGNDRQINGVYCSDLLSLVMGSAICDNAWITVMGNINSIAVVSLADISCIILSENSVLDDDALSRAKTQNICVLATSLPTYEAAVSLYEALK